MTIFHPVGEFDFSGYTLVIVRHFNKKVNSHVIDLRLCVCICYFMPLPFLFQPSVSVGNVGQLSADLLISSISCTHSGYIWHDALLPLVGNHPFSEHSHKLALGAEG